MTHNAENDAALTPDEHASLVAQIHRDGSGLLDLLDEAKSAVLDAVPRGTFVDPRPLQEAVLAAWLEANNAHLLAQAWQEGFDSDYEGDGWPPNPYRVTPPAVSNEPHSRT